MEKSRTPSERTSRSWWMYLLFGLPLVFCVFLVLIFLLLRTDSGMQHLENLANRILRAVPEQRVTLSGLHGRFPFDMRLNELRLADVDGEWLEINGLVLRWSGRDLLMARLRVVELSASQATLHRVPQVEDREEPVPRQRKPFQVPALPKTYFQAAVDRLAVEKIILAEAVTGRQSLLRFDGNLEIGRAGVALNVRLEALGDPATLLAVHAGFEPETDMLTMGLDFQDSGGLFASVLGLPTTTPLHFQFAGNGPPTSWTGTFQVQAGTLLSLASDVALDWQDHPKLDWTGSFLIDPSLLPEPIDAYLPETFFRITAALPMTDQIRLVNLTMENEAARASFNADLDLSQSRSQGALQLDILDTTPLNKQLGVELGTNLLVQGTFSGPVNAPDIRCGLTMEDIIADPVRIGTLGLDTTITFLQEDDLKSITATGALRAGGLQIPDAVPSQTLNVDFSLDYIPEHKHLELQTLVLETGGLALQADAQLSLESNRLAARISLPSTPLQPWLSPHGLEYSGEVSLRAAANGTIRPLAMVVDFHTGLEKLDGLPQPVADILGDSVSLQTMVALNGSADTNDYAGSGFIQVTDIHLHSKELQLYGNADYLPPTKQLHTMLRLEVPDLARAVPDLAPDLSGGILLDARLEGTLDRDLALQATLSSDDLAVKGRNVDLLQVVLLAESLTSTPKGNVSFSTILSDMTLSGQSDFALEKDSLTFSNLLLRVPEGSLQGLGEIDLENGIVGTDLSGRITDINPLAGLAGLDLHGSLDVQVSSRSGFAGGQDADFLVDVTDFRSDFGVLHNFSLQAQARDLFVVPEFEATATIEGLQAGGAQVEALTARVNGTVDELALHLTTRGRALHAFDLDLQAAYLAPTTASASHIVRLHHLEGDWADQSLSLSAPVEIIRSASDLNISPLLLELGQAGFGGQLVQDKDGTDLRLTITDLPLDLLASEVLGTLSAEVNLTGPPSAMRADLTLHGREMGSSQFRGGKDSAVDMQLEAVVDAGEMIIAGSVHRVGEVQPLLEGRGRMPARFALDPFGLEMPAEGVIDAGMHGTLDLNWLGNMLLPETQLLTGGIDLDLALTGPLSDLAPSGYIRVSAAGYQHLQQGVFLRDIKADLALDEHVLQLQSLSVQDGESGSLSGIGHVRLDPEDGFPFSFALQSSGLRLLDSKMVSAVLAELQLDIAGSTTEQVIQGLLTFQSVEVRLTDLGGPAVVELDVVEVNELANEADRPEAEEVAVEAPPSLLLDVEAQFPARVFVRGRGLDSEWGGRLHMTGSAQAPAVRGDINLQRGRLDLLGKRFTLSEESVLRFVGTQPPRPYVNIQATQIGREGDTFTLNVRGVVPDVDIHLSSDPQLPEDEILARMLFGRTLTSITPIQAAKLALAARELAGQGGGLDVFDVARDILQLDDLDIVSDEQDNNMNLRTGKYLTEQVYLRLESDLSTGGEQVSVDVELTPKINLESKTGHKGSGIGLFWKWDY